MANFDDLKFLIVGERQSASGSFANAACEEMGGHTTFVDDAKGGVSHLRREDAQTDLVIIVGGDI